MGWTALGQAPDISTLSVEQLVTKASSLPSRGKGADLVRHLSRSAAGSALLTASPRLLYPQGTLTYKIWTLLLTRFPAEPARVKQVCSPPGTGEG